MNYHVSFKKELIQTDTKKVLARFDMTLESFEFLYKLCSSIIQTNFTGKFYFQYLVSRVEYSNCVVFVTYDFIIIFKKYKETPQQHVYNKLYVAQNAYKFTSYDIVFFSVNTETISSIPDDDGISFDPLYDDDIKSHSYCRLFVDIEFKRNADNPEEYLVYCISILF
jgi:hypothetical protein